MASGSLRDLLAATEPVGDDQPVVGRAADGGEKFQLSDGSGDVVLVALEAEGASHAAASGSGRLEVDADAGKERLLVGHLHDRLVMAMSVEQGPAVELRKRRRAGVALQKFAEQECLFAERLSAFVVGKKVDEFVAKDGNATRFESDDGNAGFNL